MINPVTLAWQHSNKNTDGTAFNAAQYAGTEISFDGTPAVSIPVAFAANGQYQIAAATIAAFAALANGGHNFSIRLVNSAGSKSGLATPLAFDIDKRVPEIPFGLSAS
jgi:hypothetical protein